MCFHVSGHSHCMRSDTRGLKDESYRWTDGAVSNNFNRQRRDGSCKKSQESGHARKTVLAGLSQKKESSAATRAMKQARDAEMLAQGCARTRVSRNSQVSKKKQVKKKRKHKTKKTF